MRLSKTARRRPVHRAPTVRDLFLDVERFEPRVLMAAGPLQVTIVEAETFETVVITDNVGADGNPSVGAISYSTPATSPFTDFSISGLAAFSNRTSTDAGGLLSQSGTILRLSTLDGKPGGVPNLNGLRTLTITVTDTGFTHPTNLTKLTSSSSVTFTNTTLLAQSQFQSFVNATASPIVTLTASSITPNSHNGDATTTLTGSFAPYDLKNIYQIKLAPRTPGGVPSTARYLDTGTARVDGANLTASLSGVVFSDLNHDLLQNGGETGLDGVTLTLSGKDLNGNTVSQTTTTTPAGTYNFTALPPSDATGYTVTQGATPGYVHEGEVLGSTGGLLGARTITTVLHGGDNSTQNNFAEEKFATVGDYVWVDTNANGIQDDGNTGINGVVVDLLDSTMNIIATRTTATNGVTLGYYQFSVPSGTYTVAVNPSNFTGAGALVGYANSPTLQGGNTTLDSNPNPSMTSPIILPPAGADPSIDFGFYRPVTIGNFVWADGNANGVQDAGEPGIAGVALTLTGTDGAGNPVTRPATTGAGGAYLFTEAPGTYTVRVDAANPALAGLVATATGKGTTATDSNAGPSATTPGTLASGGSDPTIDFGFYKPATIGGFVYHDSNNDGIKQLTETPIAGVTLTLTGTNSLGNTVTATTTSGADGSYAFTGLLPGTYAITETQPGGYLDGKDTSGTGVTSGAVAGTAPIYDRFAVGLSGGDAGVNFNFGELKAAVISGFAYIDANDNGAKDAGETGLSGVAIRLTGTDDLGNPVSTPATTSSTGAYSFGNLRPGTYSVSETQPAGYSTTGNTVGSLNGSLATPKTDLIATIPVTSGANGVNYNFGELATGSALVRGQTATIGFWHNNNGQALIMSLNGGPTATGLGNWLSSSFGNVYSGLAGKTNSQIAAYFQTLFDETGQKTGAQFLAGALAVYSTTPSLAGGTMATQYGFTVSAGGTGIATYDVGTSLVPFGGPQGRVSIIQLIQFINSKSVGGVLANGNASLLNVINTIFSGINETGDIR